MVKDTPLHCAILSGDKRTVLVLLGHGSSIYTKNKEGHSPLHTAVRCNNKNLEIVTLLVEYGADLLTKDNKSDTILKTLQKQTDIMETEAKAKKKEEKASKKCPSCAELIKKEAKVCKHCGKEIEES